MRLLVAHEFKGGGACPTQFYFHNKDKSLWYYFRYRNGHWFLKENTVDFEECSPIEYVKAEVVADDLEGNEYDGNCSKIDCIKWLAKKGIYLIIVSEIKEEECI